MKLKEGVEDHEVFYSLNKISKNARKTKLKTLKRQNYECSICRVKLDGGRKTHWDHCHKTGKFRAWLCQSCNNGLGLFKDNPKFLRQAAAYIELHEAANLELEEE